MTLSVCSLRTTNHCLCPSSQPTTLVTVVRYPPPLSKQFWIWLCCRGLPVDKVLCCLKLKRRTCARKLQCYDITEDDQELCHVINLFPKPHNMVSPFSIWLFKQFWLSELQLLLTSDCNIIKLHKNATLVTGSKAMESTALIPSDTAIHKLTKCMQQT